MNTQSNVPPSKCPSPELSSLTMRSVMTPVPITIDEDTDLSTARKTLREKKIRHLPVVHEGRLTGILSERDTRLVSLLPEISKMAVADVMSRKPQTVGEEMPVLEAVSKMTEKKYGCLVVTDGTGGICGIFTSQDALRLLLGERGLKTPAPTTYPSWDVQDEECMWD